MRVELPNTFLALGPQAAPGQPSPPIWMNLFPLLLLVVVFYFAIMRPQQKRQKDQAALLKAVRPGDRILTNSGIVGTVITVKEKTLSIRSADSKFEITKSAIAEITERSGDSSES